jgi:predicted fused transcriptional regulator/phosphomethylpyrimidine kinase
MLTIKHRTCYRWFMETVHNIFDTFGGSSAVAKALGVGQSTASEMKRRASIPVKYWPALVEAASEQGLNDITVERLASIMAGHRAS